MKKTNNKILKFSIVLLFSLNFHAQVNVNLNLNVKHSVGNVSTFERWKFITSHANQTEQEWDGDNVISHLRNDFLNGRNIFLGRDTGI
ncbi:hypothetical protein SLW70_08420 [Flavobacterium sp. NG2]|uniref:hypothetical protein n=1 Tax=Flavobacterium sp. NG2 TaxID=3097547 RepID=UPI002A7F86D8|nr:hypothetical protein [Flavobacterium sp. NG2]WPR73130.1 hypothetical protein SLW70_08420 [Flavobacterium sp. NG2]